MRIEQKDLEFCLRKAAEIGHQYQLTHLGADDPVRSVDSLLHTCRTHLNVNIRLLELHFHKEESVVLAQCVMHGDGSFDIGYVRGLDAPMRRFAVCKELFHVLIDKDEYRQMDLVGLVTSKSIQFAQDEARSDPWVAAEFLAQVAAMEFLFPLKAREQLLAAAGGQIDNFEEIAARYQVPQTQVERYLSDHLMTLLAKHRVD